MHQITTRFFSTILLILSFSLTASAETFKVALYDGGSPPLFFEKGDANTGIYVDLLNEIALLTGHVFDYGYFPTQRAMVLFESGDLHLEPGINPVWRSSSKVPGEFSIPFAKAEDVVLFQAEKLIPVNSASDLTGKKVGTIKGFYYPGYMEAFSSGALLRKDSLSEDNLMLKLAHNRIDVAFIRKEAAQYRIKVNNEFKNLVFKDRISSVDIMLRVHPSKSDALGSLNSAIKTLKENGTIETIFQKYR